MLFKVLKGGGGHWLSLTSLFSKGFRKSYLLFVIPAQVESWQTELSHGHVLQ